MDNAKKEQFIFGSIFLIANKLQVIGDQFLGSDGMTTKQWFLTVIITQFQNNPPSLSKVAELMGSSRQNVKQLAIKLEEKDFLRIEKDKKDARTLRLILTDKSREFWKQRQEKDDKFIRDLFSGMNEEEVTAVAGGIEKLIRKLEEWGNYYDTLEGEE